MIIFSSIVKKKHFGTILFFVIAILSLLFIHMPINAKDRIKNDRRHGRIHPHGKPAPHILEIVSVEHTPCISPGGDGQNSEMSIDVHLKATPRKRVYGFLFIKKEHRFVRLIGSSSFVNKLGDAVIKMTWDGKDWKKRMLVDGSYHLRLYVFNFPTLFNSLGFKPDKAYEKLTAAMIRPKKGKNIKRWTGTVAIDTIPPYLVVTTPENGLETDEESIETSGVAEGGIVLKINNLPVPLDGTGFTYPLSLEIGENRFLYTLEDCAGNRAVHDLTVTRILPRPPMVTIQAIPTTIKIGESSTLTWTSSYAQTVTIDNGIGAVASSGSISVSPANSTTYTITASGPGGTTSAVAAVEVTYPAPSVTFSAAPASIPTGESASLTWTTRHADSVRIDNGIGEVELNGAVTVSPFATTTYTITVDGPGGTASETVTVEIIDAEPVISFDVSPASIDPGESCTLSWSVQYADNISIDNGIGTVAPSGSLTLTPSETTTYRLTASGPGGSSETLATVEVSISPDDYTAIYGRVFDINNGTPLDNAIITANGKTVRSDTEGYWNIAFGSGGTFKISIFKDGYTEVNRKIRLSTGEEGVVDNAYLTQHDSKTTVIGQEGGIHSNSDGTVEVVIPEGALDGEKDIRVTRLSSSKALPGGLNATDHLEYPIGFLFCADFGPNDTQFNTPVKIRVQNTWGFAAGTKIPYAYWNKETQKWVPVGGMAQVDADGQWLEAKITHFSYYDINSPLSFGNGFPVYDFDPFPENNQCGMGSTVDVTNGVLRNSFNVPGVNVRGGNTGVELVYTSKTAHPSEIIRIRSYMNTSLVDTPSGTTMKVNSPLVARGGVSSGSGATLTGSSTTFDFNPPSLSTGQETFSQGALVLGGSLPSGRGIATGFKNVGLSVTNHYPGQYYTALQWGGKPIANTGVSSIEPEYYEENREERIFMVSRKDSPFGKGWFLRGLKKLHIENDRVVVIDADASYRTYVKGINYADTGRGASVNVNHNMMNTDSMLSAPIVWEAQHKSPSRFYEIPGSDGTDQTIMLDLGQERTIYEIGIDFPKYWQAFSIWDYVEISTSTDKQNWNDWSRLGEPTLSNPANGMDPMDNKINSPLMATGNPRIVRYIRYKVGFPSANSAHNGSMIFRVFALGSESEYRHVDEEPWPRLEFHKDTRQYSLTYYSGDRLIFDTRGNMTAQKDPRGRTVEYRYTNEKLTRIAYPEGVYMDFLYDGKGQLEYIKDSSGRTTQIITDAAGQIKQVIYQDGTQREFEYEERGLMTMDKNGEAVKTYSWHNQWPILLKVTLPNLGERDINPGVLKYLLNTLANRDTPVDFPLVAEDDGFDSEVTFEDGIKRKYIVGKGWKSLYVNGKLKEKVIFANKKKNRFPTLIESGEDAEETVSVGYTKDMQIGTVRGKYKDRGWIASGTDQHAPYTPSSSGDFTMNTYAATITYDDNRRVSRTAGYDSDLIYSYDERGNIIRQTYAAFDKTLNFTYNDADLPDSVQFADGKMNYFKYNDQGLLMEVTKNDGGKIVLTRNARGEVVSVTDEADRTTGIERDIMGRVIGETDHSGREIAYQWNSPGCQTCGGSQMKLTKIIDPGKNEWEFKYDIMGNVTELIYPDRSRILKEYDLAGRLIKLTNKRNQTTQFVYDAEGRLNRKITPEGDTVFTYDDRDRIAGIDMSGYRYRYRYGVASVPYDSTDNTIVEEKNLDTGLWSQHVYNRHGLPREYHDSFEWKKSYTYNFSQPGGTPVGFSPAIVSYHKRRTSGQYSTIYTYDRGFRLYSKLNTYLNTERQFRYDDTGRLGRIGMVNQYGYAGFPESAIDLNRDLSGFIDSLTGGKQLTVNINSAREIEGVNHTVPEIFNESYTYDTRGNRLTSLTNTYVYNNLNRLLESGTHSFQYDADGNLITETDKTTGEAKKYSYDSGSRLIRFEHYSDTASPPDTVARYTYDHYGRRLKKEINGTVTHFFWEGNNLAYELDNNFQPVRRYIFGAGKDRVEGHIEFSEVSGNLFDVSKKGWYSYVKDQVGTVYKVYSDSTRQMAETRTYDTFGNLVRQTGSSGGNLGFQGKYFDQESGLYYFFHRYYHPSNGRFLNEDPIGLSDGINMYKFSQENPVNFIDPFGLNAITNHPHILTLACKLWKKADFGNSQGEYGCWLYKAEVGDIFYREPYWWQPSGEAGEARTRGPFQNDSNIIGSIHTHPKFFQGNTRRRPTRPESPDDRRVARSAHHRGKPMYVISYAGIYSMRERLITYSDFENWCRCHNLW